jgi:hypothetical protein
MQQMLLEEVVVVFKPEFDIRKNLLNSHKNEFYRCELAPGAIAR